MQVLAICVKYIKLYATNILELDFHKKISDLIFGNLVQFESLVIVDHEEIFRDF